MFNHRQNIDIQSTVDKGSALSRPRGPTPIRKAPVRTVGNKENMLNPGNQWMAGQAKKNNNYEDKQLLLPDNNLKKPLISPVRNPFKTQIQSIYEQQKRTNKFLGNQKQQHNSSFCANHPNKNAEFSMDIEDEILYYCSRCAAQLASQGFQVRKMQPLTVKKGDYHRAQNQNQQSSQQHQLPMYPQYQGNPMYELILEFLTQLSQVQNQHLQNMTKLTLIDSNYTEQIEQTKYFYEQLQNFIDQMRDDHINDLVQQSRKHSQIADIEHDYLRQNVQEISNIRKDIQQNLETIVQKLDEEDLKNNLNYYKQKLQVYRHKVQEQADFFDKVISYNPEEYQSKLSRVQVFLMDVWNTDEESSSFQGSQRQSQGQAPPPQLLKYVPQNQQMHQIQQQYQPHQQNQVQEKFFQKFIPNQPVSQNKPLGPFPNLIKAPSNPNQPNSARMQNPEPAPTNIPKKLPIQTPTEPENKSTAFRKLFQQDEDQVMAQTSPQFKKI